MLVLSRKREQTICIGQNVKVTVLQVKGKTVRLGIEAPDAVRVRRAELPVPVPPDGPVPLTGQTGESMLDTDESIGDQADGEPVASRGVRRAADLQMA